MEPQEPIIHSLSHELGTVVEKRVAGRTEPAGEAAQDGYDAVGVDAAVNGYLKIFAGELIVRSAPYSQTSRLPVPARVLCRGSHGWYASAHTLHGVSLSFMLLSRALVSRRQGVRVSRCLKGRETRRISNLWAADG